MRNIQVTSQTGFSLIELLVALALLGVLCTVAVTNIHTLENPLVSTSSNMSHYFRLVRVRAIAQTRSIRIAPGSAYHLEAGTASNCEAETFEPLSELDFDLDEDVRLGSTDWSVCFTQRGLVHQAVAFVLTGDNGSRTVEIALGGGVNIE